MMMNRTTFTKSILYFFISIELNFCLSQIVTRFSNQFDTDEFPNTDTTCSRQGCRNSNAYKQCTSCCSCRCNYGSYWSATKRCLVDFEIAKDCKFVLGSGSDPNAVKVTSATGLQSGLEIFYCPNTWSICSTKATQCMVQRATTFYDNNGWKVLWKGDDEVDMKMIVGKGVTDKLQRTSASCSRKIYDGLLISLGLTCNIGSSSVSSCLAFKIAGSYRIGSNPVARNNCTTTTTQKTTIKTTTATSTAATTATSKAVVATAKTETTTTHAETTTAHAGTTTTQAEATTTKEEATTTSAAATVIKSTIQSTSKSSTGITPRKTSHSNSSVVTQPTIPETTATPSNTQFKNSTKNGDIGHRDSKTSSSGKVTAIAVSLSIAAVLLIIIIIILLTCYIKGRRSQNYQEHHDNRKIILNISNPQPLNRSAPLPIGAQGNPSGVLWTINANGDFVAIDSAPVFTIYPKGAQKNLQFDVDDDEYDEPITRRASSLGKLYAVVKKHRSSKKDKENGYSSIDEIPLSIATKNASLKDQKDGDISLSSAKKSTIISGDNKSSTAPPKIMITVENEPLYDLPENGNQRIQKDGNSQGNEPIYAIYEPAGEEGREA